MRVPVKIREEFLFLFVFLFFSLLILIKGKKTKQANTKSQQILYTCLVPCMLVQYINENGKVIFSFIINDDTW